jgi:hypothetical protein
MKPEEMKKHHKGVQRPFKHEGYDKHPGNAHGKEVKKGGHGKGGWGGQDFDRLGKHHSADHTSGLLESEYTGEEQEDQMNQPGEMEETNESSQQNQLPKRAFKMSEGDFPALST